MSDKKSLGGAATNRGIWYQALWCVLCAASARIKRTDDTEDRGGHVVSLVLEPLGGDALVERAEGRRVVQLKTLGNGTWSIKRVVEDVLPDLYRALTTDSPTNSTYEFITEGGFGDWSEVLAFFNSLDQGIESSSPASKFSTAYAALDDKTQLKFRGSTSEFWKRNCTRRALFDRIVAHLSTTPAAKDETIDETRRKTWHMLARFHFTGGVSEEALRQDLGAAMLPIVHHREDIPNVLDAMVGWIIKHSSENTTTITPEELFKAHDLKYVSSISQWAAMKESCQTQCRRRTGLRGYRPEWDVRFSLGDAKITLASAPFIVVCGDSGLGKSWCLYAQTHVGAGLAPVILDSKGDAEGDLQRAADRVWRDALGHDDALPLQNLARRRADVLKRPQQELWLRICLDGLTSPGAAQELLNNPVEDWGVQMIVACNEQAARVFEEHQRDHQDRVQLVRLDRFTPTERDKYLGHRLGDGWVDLPADVRELLRKPQLAGLYCQLFEELGNWRPQNEYELIEKFWKSLKDRDALHLANLAATLCGDAQYPWDEDQLETSRIDEEDAQRMRSCGWLRRSSGTHYEVPHDRLLNFAVAKGITVSRRSVSRSHEAIADLLRRMLEGDSCFKSITLGYVPMDWFFLRLKDDKKCAEDVLELVAGGLQHHTLDILYRDLLPTLGVAAVRPLVSRLANLAATGNWFDTKAVVAGLSKLPTDSLRVHVERLLVDERPRVRRVALMVLGQRPFPEVLDTVWKLHIEMQLNPEKFFGDEVPADRKTAIWLYDDSFEALRECARLNPGWVVSTIRHADSETEPAHDLAYLTASLGDDGKTWRACKAELFEKVSCERRRCLAQNIGTWRDLSELHHLESWLDVEEDLLGPAALRALSQIDPKQAAARLSVLSENLQYLCRGWHLPRLMLSAPDETRRELHKLVRQSKDPLKTSLVFQGCENEMDGPTLEILLDALDEALAAMVDKSNSSPGDRRPTRYTDPDSLYVPMLMLAAVCRRDLLSVFESRRDTSLEKRLERLLTDEIGARGNLWQDNLTREPALKVLLKICGEGHGRVVSAFLDAESEYGKLDAIQEARKNTGHDRIEKLRRIALSDERWADTSTPVLQMESMRALASVGDGDGVLNSALRLGLHVPRDITDWMRPSTTATAEAIEEASRIVRERDATRLPGALIGLGLFGTAEVVDDIVAVLRDPPDSTAQIAAILGLGRLGQPANGAVSLIGECIADTRTRYAAVVALSRIGSSEARGWLLESLTDTWDASLAIRLTQFSALRTQALSLLAERLRSTEGATTFALRSDLRVFLAEAADELLVEVLPSLSSTCDHIREAAFAREDSFWIVGSKASAIRGLAAIDSDAASVAARKALADADAHDRQLYALLLTKMNVVAARDFYLELAAVEGNKSVLWSMAHTMRSTDVPWVLEQLSAALPGVRLAACRLAAGNALDDDSLRAKLLETLADPDERVANAAEQSLRAMRRQQRASRLADELEQESHNTGLKPWIVLEAALQIGHSGYEGTQWPEWAKRLADSNAFKAWPALGLTLHERMLEERKNSLQEANR